jgi:exopolysaccharide biosynthesis polyprenyl glycosylphosphotransferase
MQQHISDEIATPETVQGAPSSRSLEVVSDVSALAPAASARREYRKVYRAIAVSDAFAIIVGLLAAVLLRFGLSMPSQDFLLLMIAVPTIMLAIFSLCQLYEAHRYSPAEEFRRILLGVSLGMMAVLAISFWSKAEFSRLWLGLSWTFVTVGVLATRRLWHAKIATECANGRLAFPTLIVGTNDEAVHLAEVMDRPSFGFRPIGMVSTGDEPGATELPVLGPVDELRDVIRASGAECVFVAASSLSVIDMESVAKAVRLEGVEVRVTATLPEVLASRVAVQSLGGITALSLRPVRLSGIQAAIKRVFDVAVAGIAAVALSPILLTIAALVKLTSSGPVLFRQTRVGQRGRPFTILKFRTMRDGADEMVDELRRSHDVQDLMFKLPDDPRVTGVGKFLRRWSLDELPQLFNVIRGDMSLVGPRPPLPEEVASYEDWQFDRLEVPPGVSGLWQVSGRSNLSFEDCVRLDLFYIENWSLAYDLYILAKTVPSLLSARGAY